MGRVGVIVAIIAGAILGGCQARLDPLDEPSSRAGIPIFDFVWAGFEHGPVKVAMPSGEVLVGEYRIVENGMDRRPLSARAVGDAGTTMNCEGFVEIGYHGAGVCRTGRHRYQFTF